MCVCSRKREYEKASQQNLERDNILVVLLLLLLADEKAQRKCQNITDARKWPTFQIKLNEGLFNWSKEWK